MGNSYATKPAVSPTPVGPTDWPQDWSYPGPPWPPGWPTDNPDPTGYLDLSDTVLQVAYRFTNDVVVVAKATGGATTTDFDGRTVRLSCKRVVDGTTIQMKQAGGNWNYYLEGTLNAGSITFHPAYNATPDDTSKMIKLSAVITSFTPNPVGDTTVELSAELGLSVSLSHSTVYTGEATEAMVDTSGVSNGVFPDFMDTWFVRFEAEMDGSPINIKNLRGGDLGDYTLSNFVLDGNDYVVGADIYADFIDDDSGKTITITAYLAAPNGNIYLLPSGDPVSDDASFEAKKHDSGVTMKWFKVGGQIELTRHPYEGGGTDYIPFEFILGYVSDAFAQSSESVMGGILFGIQTVPDWFTGLRFNRADPSRDPDLYFSRKRTLSTSTVEQKDIELSPYNSYPQSFDIPLQGSSDYLDGPSAYSYSSALLSFTYRDGSVSQPEEGYISTLPTYIP